MSVLKRVGALLLIAAIGALMWYGMGVITIGAIKTADDPSIWTEQPRD